MDVRDGAKATIPLAYMEILDNTTRHVKSIFPGNPTDSQISPPTQSHIPIPAQAINLLAMERPPYGAPNNTPAAHSP